MGIVDLLPTAFWLVAIVAAVLWLYGVTHHQHGHEMHHFYIGLVCIALGLVLLHHGWHTTGMVLAYLGLSMLVDDGLEHTFEHPPRAGPSAWRWLYGVTLYPLLHRAAPGRFA